jgi:hypothetical protein
MNRVRCFWLQIDTELKNVCPEHVIDPLARFPASSPPGELDSDTPDSHIRKGALTLRSQQARYHSPKIPASRHYRRRAHEPPNTPRELPKSTSHHNQLQQHPPSEQHTGLNSEKLSTPPLVHASSVPPGCGKNDLSTRPHGLASRSSSALRHAPAVRTRCE